MHFYQIIKALVSRKKT